MAEAEEPKKKSKAKWIILIIILALFGVGGGAAWHFFLGDMIMAKVDAAKSEPKKVVQEKGPALTGGQVVPLPPFRVNLADPLGKRFIKLVVEVEMSSPAAVDELNAQQAAVRDSIILLLSSKSLADISTMESKILLKGEITQRINQILGGPKVIQVFFTDLVIQ